MQDNVVIEKELTARAITTCGSHRDERRVFLRMFDEMKSTAFCGPHADTLRKMMSHKWTLIIDGTPGQWYLSDILGKYLDPKSYIFIDGGQDWRCTNIAAILKEAREIM